MAEQRTNSILAFILILIIIATSFFIFYYFKLNPEILNKDKIKEDDYFDMRISCPDYSSYVIYYKNINIFQGTISPKYIEKISNLVLGRNYVVYCYSDTEYIAMKDCTNQTYCKLELEKEGKIKTDYDIRNNKINLTINVSQGMIRESLFCLSWFNSQKISTNLNETNVPVRLRSYIDRCYILGTIKNEEKNVIITYEKNNRDAEIKYFILDTCEDKQLIFSQEEDCGVKDYIQKLSI